MVPLEKKSVFRSSLTDRQTVLFIERDRRRRVQVVGT
jgi:hypothetical protein